MSRLFPVFSPDKLIRSGIAVCLAMCLLTACKEEMLPPEVDFPQGLIYKIKTMDTLYLEPSYSHVDGHTRFSWSLDGVILSEKTELQFVPTMAGRYYIALLVENGGGEARSEIRVDVAERECPTVSLPAAREGLTLVQNSEYEICPQIQSALPCRYQWRINGELVSNDSCLCFPTSKVGTSDLEFLVENADGSDGLHLTVRVLPEEEFALSWYLPQHDYYLSVGRRIRLCPLEIPALDKLTFRWSMEGRILQEGSDPAWIFEAGSPGDYSLCLEMSDGWKSLVWTPDVHVCAEEYRRPQLSDSRSSSHRVYEYLPAPGQFINEGFSCQTMEEACRYAEQQMQNGGMLSLGGFGGSLTVGFDHSVENDGGYNLAVRGNAFEHSSEPAVVWVMQDENGNGLPDDTWYELKGSEYGNEGYLPMYAVRYYRPAADRRAVPWTDSEGRQGSVPYHEAYHSQSTYYPAWVREDSYLLSGSRLGARNHLSDGSSLHWTNDDYGWGYADNYSLTDMREADGTLSNENHFRISDAVGFDGQPVHLPYIDFVKIQSAVNASSGWLGEVSSEVSSVRDYNMLKAGRWFFRVWYF